MDYGSVYIQWDTPIRGWEEYILQHILPQTPQWKHNSRVHNNIESLGLGVKTVGKGGSQIVGASLGLETARTTNEFLSYFPVPQFLFIYLLHCYYDEIELDASILILHLSHRKLSRRRV